MAKDPAVLWYWNDWNGGTMTFTRHQKGCYIDLLAAQFNSGPLSLEQVKTVLGTDQAVWTVLSAKFKKKVNSDNTEVFFNERMEAEKKRRSEFSNKQRENGLLGGRPKKPNPNPTLKPNKTNIENEIENETATGIETVFGKSETLFDWQSVKTNFFNDFRWIEKFCNDKSLLQPDLETHMREFISDLELQEEFKDLKEIKRHFTNWFNKNKKNGTHQRSAEGNGFKQGTSAARIAALKKF